MRLRRSNRPRYLPPLKIDSSRRNTLRMSRKIDGPFSTRLSGALSRRGSRRHRCSFPCGCNRSARIASATWASASSTRRRAPPERSNGYAPPASSAATTDGMPSTASRAWANSRRVACGRRRPAPSRVHPSSCWPPSMSTVEHGEPGEPPPVTPTSSFMSTFSALAISLASFLRTSVVLTAPPCVVSPMTVALSGFRRTRETRGRVPWSASTEGPVADVRSCGYPLLGVVAPEGPGRREAATKHDRSQRPNSSDVAPSAKRSTGC